MVIVKEIINDTGLIFYILAPTKFYTPPRGQCLCIPPETSLFPFSPTLSTARLFHFCSPTPSHHIPTPASCLIPRYNQNISPRIDSLQPTLHLFLGQCAGQKQHHPPSSPCTSTSCLVRYHITYRSETTFSKRCRLLVVQSLVLFTGTCSTPRFIR
jgi:hypothetical protein